MEFQGDWTIRKSNPAAFLIASEVTTPGSPMAHVGEVVQSSPFFKETIYLITNNLSDFNDYEQLFLLLIKKYLYTIFLLVRTKGVEPLILSAEASKTSMYTSSNTSGYTTYLCPDGVANHPQLYIA